MRAATRFTPQPTRGRGAKSAAAGGLLVEDLVVRARDTRAQKRVSTPRRAVDLDDVASVFRVRTDAASLRADIDRALARASNLAAAGEVSTTIALSFASDVFALCAIEGPWTRRGASRVVSRLASLLDLPEEAVSLRLFLGAVGGPQLLDLPPGLALEAQLRMLVALGPIVETSFWTQGLDGRPACLIAIGAKGQTRRFRAVAAIALEGKAGDSGSRGAILGTPVMRWDTPWAALVVRTRLDSRRTAGVYLAEAGRAMSPVIERELILQRSAARERSLVQASERRLGRLAFDLHDGALQHVAALGADLHLFRSQLSQLQLDARRGIVVPRVDDLQARVTTLDGVLRELAHSLEPSSLVRRPLPRVIADEVSAFVERTGIDVDQRVVGDFSTLTTSQALALIRVVQEALTNVREHANATRVRVEIIARSGRVDARVEDDGIGFRVDRTLLDSARRGRLGLVGSSERIRLLGGKFDVRSRPGGPTTISVTLPRWQPLAATESHEDAAPALS
jgi:signal transduction histidine kinase